MAYRGGAAVAGSGTTQTVTVTGIGIQLNDIVLLCLCDYIGNTPTWPTGFAVVPGTSSEPNDGNTGLFTYYKVATSTEVSATTLSVTGVNFGGALQCRVYSGRSTSAPFTTNQSTVTAAAAFPVTFSITGVTAAASDDVVVFIGQDITAGTTAATLSYTPSSGFANGLLANDTGTTNAEWIGSSDKVNVSAGATGTIAGSISVTSGAGPGQTGYLAQVISIAINFVPLPLAIRQTCVGFSGNTSVNFQTGSFASATLAGSTIYVVTTGLTIGLQHAFADAINGPYNALDTVIDSGTALTRGQSFMLQNAASIGTSQVLTVTPASSSKYLGFVAFEIQSAPNPPMMAAHAGVLVTNASAALNAIASATVQAGIGSAIAIAVTQNPTNNNAVYIPSVGTGWTLSPSPANAFWPLAAAPNMATSEYQTLTNPGGMNATFTAPLYTVASASQTVATPGVFTTATQSFAVNDQVYLTGTAPGGLALNTPYYVIAAGLTTTSCQLSATQGGSGLQVTSSAACTINATHSDDYITFIAVFNSVGGAFVPPFTLTQFFVNDQYIQM